MSLFVQQQIQSAELIRLLTAREHEFVLNVMSHQKSNLVNDTSLFHIASNCHMQLEYSILTRTQIFSDQGNGRFLFTPKNANEDILTQARQQASKQVFTNE